MFGGFNLIKVVSLEASPRSTSRRASLRPLVLPTGFQQMLASVAYRRKQLIG